MTQKRSSALVYIRLQPEERRFTMPRPKSARRLLEALGLRCGAALVIRDNDLLTPDRSLEAGDSLTVRVVISSG